MDNFEFTGLCSTTVPPMPFATDAYITDGSSPNLLFVNLYFHGWTHVEFSCSGTTGQCFGPSVFVGGQGSGLQTGTTYRYIVVDGSDSDPGGMGVFYDGMYDVEYSVFRYSAQMIGSLCHVFHDNLVEYWYDPGDGYSHGNTYECVGEASGTNAYYNNILRHTYTVGSSGVSAGVGDGFWIGPSSGTTDYFFNNLFYDIDLVGNYFNIQNPSGGTVYAFNSTLQSSVSGGVMDCQGGSRTYAVNMHLITDASSPFYGGTCAATTNLFQSNATANGQGYTSSETFAYSPASGSAGTVGTGTNEQSYCTALSGAGLSDAATACQSDTRYACTYNSTNHTVTCPGRTVVARPLSGAWNVGAYQFVSSTTNPPSNLTETTH
jgi:hypothetical protein